MASGRSPFEKAANFIKTNDIEGLRGLIAQHPAELADNILSLANTAISFDKRPILLFLILLAISQYKHGIAIHLYQQNKNILSDKESEKLKTYSETTQNIVFFVYLSKTDKTPPVTPWMTDRLRSLKNMLTSLKQYGKLSWEIMPEKIFANLQQFSMMAPEDILQTLESLSPAAPTPSLAASPASSPVLTIPAVAAPIERKTITTPATASSVESPSLSEKKKKKRKKKGGVNKGSEKPKTPPTSTASPAISLANASSLVVTPTEEKEKTTASTNSVPSFPAPAVPSITASVNTASSPAPAARNITVPAKIALSTAPAAPNIKAPAKTASSTAPATPNIKAPAKTASLPHPKQGRRKRIPTVTASAPAVLTALTKSLSATVSAQPLPSKTPVGKKTKQEGKQQSTPRPIRALQPPLTNTITNIPAISRQPSVGSTSAHISGRLTSVAKESKKESAPPTETKPTTIPPVVTGAIAMPLVTAKEEEKRSPAPAPTEEPCCTAQETLQKAIFSLEECKQHERTHIAALERLAISAHRKDEHTQKEQYISMIIRPEIAKKSFALGQLLLANSPLTESSFKNIWELFHTAFKYDSTQPSYLLALIQAYDAILKIAPTDGLKEYHIDRAFFIDTFVNLYFEQDRQEFKTCNKESWAELFCDYCESTFASDGNQKLIKKFYVEASRLNKFCTQANEWLAELAASAEPDYFAPPIMSAPPPTHLFGPGPSTFFHYPHLPMQDFSAPPYPYTVPYGYYR